MAEEFVNQHQPIWHASPTVKDMYRVSCTAEGCHYLSSFVSTVHEEEFVRVRAEVHFSNHTKQYLPGSAPDIVVDWEISACCSVCEDGIGDIVTEDSESVYCKECGTTWSMDGTDGERKEDDD